MRRAAGLLLGLVAALAALPAQAAEPALTLGVTLRWDSAAQPGGWSPYVVTVKDQGGSDFTGDVALVAHQSRFNGPATPWPTYQTRLTVGRGSERSLDRSVAGRHEFTATARRFLDERSDRRPIVVRPAR